MGKLIEADALLASLRESRDRANVWLSDCREYGSEMTGRAEQAVMTFNECILRVKGAPTVDAVPVVHGKWEKHKGIFICSRCLTGYKEQPTMMGEPLFEFCPVCGTKMDGKDGDHETD